MNPVDLAILALILGALFGLGGWFAGTRAGARFLDWFGRWF